MPTIPKFTSPQAKLIRTLEGLLVVAFNLAMIVIPIVSSALPAKTAAALAAGVTTGTVIARQLAKGLMAWQAPLMPASTGEAAAPDLKNVLAEIKTVAGAQASFQGQPGAPADSLPYGLDPSPRPAAPIPPAGPTA